MCPLNPRLFGVSRGTRGKPRRYFAVRHYSRQSSLKLKTLAVAYPGSFIGARRWRQQGGSDPPTLRNATQQQYSAQAQGRHSLALKSLSLSLQKCYEIGLLIFMKICRNAYKSFIHPLPRWDTVLYTHISPLTMSCSTCSYISCLLPSSRPPVFCEPANLSGDQAAIEPRVTITIMMQSRNGNCTHIYIQQQHIHICCCCSRGAGGRRDGNVGVYTGGMVVLILRPHDTQLGALSCTSARLRSRFDGVCNIS